jgi:hypothetical protein
MRTRKLGSPNTTQTNRLDMIPPYSGSHASITAEPITTSFLFGRGHVMVKNPLKLAMKARRHDMDGKPGCI